MLFLCIFLTTTLKDYFLAVAECITSIIMLCKHVRFKLTEGQAKSASESIRYWYYLYSITSI